MKRIFRGTGYTTPRPWKQILGLHVRLSTIFNADRPCLVLPAPLVLEFPLFSGWVSSSERTRRNCHMSTSCGLGCYRETLWYEARGYSAWSCLLPSPQSKGPWCAHRWPLWSIMAGLPSCPFPVYVFTASQRAGKALPVRVCSLSAPGSWTAPQPPYDQRLLF